jgi:hypothetical protein
MEYTPTEQDLSQDSSNRDRDLLREFMPDLVEVPASPKRPQTQPQPPVNPRAPKPKRDQID